MNDLRIDEIDIGNTNNTEFSNFRFKGNKVITLNKIEKKEASISTKNKCQINRWKFCKKDLAV